MDRKRAQMIMKRNERELKTDKEEETKIGKMAQSYEKNMLGGNWKYLSSRTNCGADFLLKRYKKSHFHTVHNYPIKGSLILCRFYKIPHAHYLICRLGRGWLSMDGTQREAQMSSDEMYRRCFTGLT